MSRLSGILCCFLGVIVPLGGAPLIAYRGIVNGANFAPPGVPNGSIAQGSIFTILGSGLGPAGLAQVAAFPLGTTLAGVSIQVTQGTTTVAAIPLAVTPSQINAIMPSKAPLGVVSVKVTYNGTASNYVQAKVTAASFGIFAANSAGWGPGIVQNFVSATELPTNSTQISAKPNQTLIIWGTGLGAVADDTVAPTAGNLPGTVEVFVGGKAAAVAYSGRSPCCSGLDQIAFTVPADTPLGCYVPVQVRTGGTTPSNAVSIAISASGNGCSDAGAPAEAALLAGGKVGLVTLSRYNTREDIDFTTPTDFVTDQAIAAFRKESGGAFAFQPAISLPPSGTCTVFEKYGGLRSPSGFSFLYSMPPAAADLDAGASLAVQGVSVTRSTDSPRNYYATVGSTARSGSPTIFNPGSSLTVTGTGGADVGSFTAQAPAPPAFDFTDRLTLTAIDRQKPLTISWASTSGTVLIVGSNFDHPSNSSAAFQCVAPASAGSLTIPSYILQSLPISRTGMAESNGYVMAGLLREPVPFTAASLDAAFLATISWAAKSVVFQ